MYSDFSLDTFFGLLIDLSLDIFINEEFWEDNRIFSYYYLWLLDLNLLFMGFEKKLKLRNI